MPPLKPNVANVTIGGKAVNPYTPLSNSSSYLIGGTPKPILKPTTPVAPKLNTAASIPSTALTKPTTPTDVMTYRSQLQGVQDTATKLQSMLQGTTGKILTPGTTVNNPETAALKFLSGEKPAQTEAQVQEQGFLGSIRDKTKSFFGGRQDQIDNAYNQFGVNDARTELAKTQEAKAQRNVRLREDLKSLETSASERGVAREFAVDRRNQINSEAYFDLANISIVESAQLGNLEQARTDAKALIDEQYSSYEAEIAQYESELAYLAPTLSAEQKQQAEIVQFQLDQYKQQLQDKKDEEAAKYDYLAEAAKNGAPNSVTEAILSATTRDEAARLAAPYIGALDRANTYSLINDRANSGNGKGDSAFVELTAEDKKTLIGQGFTQSEINDIPQIVGEFGVQALLDEYANDPKKLKAVTTIYNDPIKQQFLTPEFLKSTFGASSVDEMATAMGKTRDDYRKYFSSASAEEAAIKKDFQNYINTTLVPLIEQYRASGFSDKDILAMMK